VVGVDGSVGSEHALRWAARQAELTGAALEIIVGWQFPAFFGWAPAGPDQVDFAKIAGETLSAAVSDVLGPEPPRWVSTRVMAEEVSQAVNRGPRGWAGISRHEILCARWPGAHYLLTSSCVPHSRARGESARPQGGRRQEVLGR
jgi:hypothetical protein